MSEAVMNPETPASEEQWYRLGDDVDIVRRRNTLLLVAKRSGRSVRVSPVAMELLPLLRQGSSFEGLLTCLQKLRPEARDIQPKLAAFLSPLLNTGIVQQQGGDVATATVRRRQYPLFDPNAIAQALALPLLLLPVRLRRVLYAGIPLAAATLVAWLAWQQQLPSLRYLMENMHWGGLLSFALLVVPLHEAAHAIACRVAGIPVGAAGLIMHGGWMPGPYVDTSQSYRLVSRWPRFLIPAAGPWVNLTAAGISAALLMTVDSTSPWHALLQTQLLWCLLFVFFDTTPLTASDGSHCVEAWLDDELARRHALTPTPKPDSAPPSANLRQETDSGQRYRRVLFVHSFISAVLLLWWWFGGSTPIAL
jgi:putative peptide zinc metalloprotease protein